MRLLIASPRGFCAGVDRAVAIVEELLVLHDEPVFVRHQIVHNKIVISSLQRRGAVFVDEIDQIPEGSVAVLSAHGSPPQVQAQARQRNLRLFDATCPLVTKVHLEVVRHAKCGRAVLVIGHRDHVEVQGILAHYLNPKGDGAFVVENEADALTVQPPRADSIGYVTQTTLAADQTRLIIDVLTARFPAIIPPRRQDICYATQNRQDAVRRLAETCGLILVIGAPHSSNSRRLVEVAERSGVNAQLIEDEKDIRSAWLEGVEAVGLTSSASAPEPIVQAAIAYIRSLVPALELQEIGEREAVYFRLPSELRALGASAVRHAELDRAPLATAPVPQPARS